MFLLSVAALFVAGKIRIFFYIFSVGLIPLGEGGGGGGTLIFPSYVDSGPASTVHLKHISGKALQKIFEILATPKYIPKSVH